MGRMRGAWRRRRVARANIKGGPLAPQIRGVAYFRPVIGGTMVSVEVRGLPDYQPATNDRPPVGPHAFHVHEIGDCTVTDPDDPFQEAGGHYDPDDQPHGNHAGDLPNLFSNNGYAKMTVFTNRFIVDEVVGRAVIIHKHPNDFRTQPAGAAGPRLACGVIKYI
ncbi:superoxide dismutase family protein [Natroniella sulfidigena]|uniref:superoxide dismutase family protein n=1 Tax=Natroniella sulfidigena TaxID=723921 RepID=UPI00200B0233|nr:superoxide dismutase family protein [Natroniella sulfidigena]MCK8817932.1 superoxide dismutase family protein [Natroniella sulfidigena]